MQDRARHGLQTVLPGKYSFYHQRRSSADRCRSRLRLLRFHTFRLMIHFKFLL